MYGIKEDVLLQGTQCSLEYIDMGENHSKSESQILFLKKKKKKRNLPKAGQGGAVLTSSLKPIFHVTMNQTFLLKLCVSGEEMTFIFPDVPY